MWLTLQHFRGSIAQSARRVLRDLETRGQDLRKPEVGYFRLVVFRHENVLQLQISVYDRERVQVCKGLEDRDDDVTCHILGDVEVSVLHEGPEVAAFAELLHHDVLLRVLK